MSADVVTHAQTLLDDLVKADWRGNGDLQPALRRLARATNIPYSALWALRYRPPKDVYASILIRLSAAHQAMCDRQLDRYRAARDAADPQASGVAAALSRLGAAIAGELPPT